MTEDNGSTETPNNSFYIPPPGSPVKNGPKTAEKKPGTDWLGLAYILIGFFVLIAAFQLYFTIQELIRTWFSDQFVPIISAAYYLAVIIVGVWLIREYIRKQ
jgi:hypothetical protein